MSLCKIASEALHKISNIDTQKLSPTISQASAKLPGTRENTGIAEELSAAMFTLYQIDYRSAPKRILDMPAVHI